MLINSKFYSELPFKMNLYEKHIYERTKQQIYSIVDHVSHRHQWCTVCMTERKVENDRFSVPRLRDAINIFLYRSARLVVRAHGFAPGND